MYWYSGSLAIYRWADPIMAIETKSKKRLINFMFILIDECEVILIIKHDKYLTPCFFLEFMLIYQYSKNTPC